MAICRIATCECPLCDQQWTCPRCQRNLCGWHKWPVAKQLRYFGEAYVEGDRSRGNVVDLDARFCRNKCTQTALAAHTCSDSIQAIRSRIPRFQDGRDQAAVHDALDQLAQTCNGLPPLEPDAPGDDHLASQLARALVENLRLRQRIKELSCTPEKSPK